MTHVHAFIGSVAGLVAFGAVADPVFDEFGPLPQATFGGQGIPNDEVAASTQFVDGENTLTIALSATQRFSNPALGNDGAGTYFATPGSNFGGGGESGTLGALWNFNFYLDVEGPGSPALTDYQIDFFYDFDPGADTPLGSLGQSNVTAGIFADPMIANDTDLLEGSQNALFGFLALDFPGLQTAPAIGSFDPNALGEYSFLLQVSRADGFALESVAIDVVVVPVPASAGLLVAGGVLAARRRR
ncbi:MAG: hypothetical protein AAFR96_08890 [Planctomycetota bacterium]